MVLFVLSKDNEINETIQRNCKNYKACEVAVADAKENNETRIRVCVANAEPTDFIPDFFEILQNKDNKRCAMFRVV